METIARMNRNLFHELPDPRTKNWPLLGDPLIVTSITTVWTWFVLRAGPQYMSSRKPFKLKGLLQIVNILQIVLNAYVAYEFLQSGWITDYDMFCEPCDFSTSPKAMRMANASYMYMLLKLFDMLDTVLYVLRKKDNQISFLHMYHHIGTLAIAWLGSNYAPGGSMSFSALLNSIVHVIMYTYYFLAALGPQYQRYLWWKKYLTSVQLVQFVIMFTLNVSIITNDCFRPQFIPYIFVPFISIMFGLFMKFYIKSYTKNNPKKVS